MNNRIIMDLYLPKKLAYHVKIFTGSLAITLLFKILMEGRLWDSGSIIMLIILIFQLELFIWLGGKFFNFKDKQSIESNPQSVVFRLLLFFLVAFILSAIIFLLTLAIFYLIRGIPFDRFMDQVINFESKGFFIGAGIGFSVGAVFFFYISWVEALKREKKLREEKLIFKYETLKSQVNPHFLFNSLNTLSSLVHKDADQSDEYIRRLSFIYRYILENIDIELVSLDTEIGFVKDYFYLQQIRDNGKIELEVDVPNPEKFQILPISLQMLMENAFKHNAATRENPLKIKISLDQDKSLIVFSNNLRQKQKIEKSSGIGLKNLKERMKLILQQDLEVNQTETEFIVGLPVKMNENESTDH